MDVIGTRGVVSASLDQPFARVGTHPESDVVLAEGPVNGRSLYLHAVPNGVFCLDLRRVQSTSTELGFWAKPTDEVGIGRCWLKASLQGSFPQETPKIGLDQDGSATFPRPVLSILNGNRIVAKKRLQRSLTTIGRWPQCSLHLQGQLVSGVHCALYWHEGRLWCIDLLSSNHTLHQGRSITCLELHMGERIAVGEFEILFERLSRQTDESVSRSQPERPTASISKPESTGTSPRSRRNAWKVAEPKAADTSDVALPTAISSHIHAEPSVFSTASDSAITVEPAIPVVSAQEGMASDIGIAGIPALIQLPELPQLEELSRRLHGQFTQIQSEANQLADLTRRLNLASQQWAENRAEIIGLLTTSLTPSVLSGVNTSLDQTLVRTESDAPKLAASTATDGKGESSVSGPNSEGTPSTTPSVCEVAAKNALQEAPSPAPVLVEATTAVVEPAKPIEPSETVDSKVSRPLPSGRGSRRTAVKRNELTDFVSDRMALLERQRRRKELLIGLGVAVAILLLLGIIGGVWRSLTQSEIVGSPGTELEFAL